MGVVKITFDGSNVSAKQDADINYHVTGLVPAGIIKGLGDELKATTSNNYIFIQSGYVQIYGRRIYVEANSSVYISLDSTKYGYVVIQVDLSTNTVSLTKVENTSTYPTLTQQNLATSGTIYQMPIARYTKTTTSLTLDTSFSPTVIPTTMSVANAAYDDAVSYVNTYRTMYSKICSKNYDSDVYLSTEQAETKADTYFICKMSTGQIIGFPGSGISDLSSYTCSYTVGGTSYNVIVGYSKNNKSISLTCSNTSHYVADLYGIR